MNKRALVTGADGFIGSHLVEELVKKGYAVTAFVCYNSANSEGWIEYIPIDLRREIEVVAGDIRDKGFVEKCVEGKQIVFHLAALISIPFSYSSPESYFDTNVGGTLNVLQAALRSKVDRVLTTSTSEVYGTAKYAPIDEEHPLQAQSPYSASKISADAFADSFYRSFSLPVTTVRPFNTFGPRQSARALIPTVITQILAGNKTIKLGSLFPKRDLNFVKDTVSGFIKLAQTKESVGKVFNIASSQEISVGELVEKIVSLMNVDVRVVEDSARIRPEKSEVHRLIGSNSKIKQVCDWTVEYNLSEGLKETIEWLSHNQRFYKPQSYSI